jgi:hypothetical protein
VPYTKVLILTASLEWFNLLGCMSPEAVGYAVLVRMALLVKNLVISYHVVTTF